MNPLSFSNYDKLKQNNITIRLAEEELEPSQIVAAIDTIIDDSRDVSLKDFALLPYPDSDNINLLLSNSLNDLSNLKESIVNVPSIITAEYNSTIAGIAIVNSKAAELQNKLSSLKLAVEKHGSTNTYYSIINFTDGSQIDYNFPISASYANIDTTIGVATLGKSSTESIDKISFKVLKSNKDSVRDINHSMPSNFFYEGRFYGYPQEVVPEGNDFHFNVITNPTRIISHKATDTQIEEIRSRVFDSNFDTAWLCEYVQDASNSVITPLEVSILVDLKKNFTISNLMLAPYQVNKGDFLDILSIRAGVDTVNMKDLKVFENHIEDSNNRSDKPIATSAPENGEVNNRINAMFDPLEARYIIINLRQANIVQTPYSLLKVNAIRKSPISNNVETIAFTLSYLETIALGSKYADNLDPAKLLPAILNLNGDWTISPNMSAEVRLDKVHQAIGISEISVSNNRYVATSEFITNKQVFPDTITSVTLSVDEIVPNDFGVGDWTEYYISFDSNTFQRIMPVGTGNTKGSIPSKITPTNNYKELIVKAVIKRPVNQVNLTPAIRNIKINVETK